MNKSKSLEEQLVSICHESPLDLAAVRAKIAEGADVNADRGDSVLADAIFHFGVDEGNCRMLPALVRTFLDAGYDVHRKNGLYGALSLFNLTLCFPGPEILEAAQLLLDSGADPDIAPFEDTPNDTVIDLIWDESDFQCIEYRLEQMELYDKLLELLKAKSRKNWDEISD